MLTINMGSEDRNNKEEGSALIVVLGILAILTLLVTHLTVSTMIAAKEATVVAERSALRYKAEAACDRTFWQHLIDRRQHSNRNLAVGDRFEKDLDISERWLANGVEHELGTKRYPVEIRLIDNNKGIIVKPAEPEKTLRNFLKSSDTDTESASKSEDIQYSKAVNKFFDVLKDYIDNDGQDMKHLHGKEQPDYADEGFPDMPRNNKLQLAAELLWIEGLEETPAFRSGTMTPQRFLDVVRLEDGRRRSGNNKPNFFSADAWFIKRHAELTDEQMSEIENALRDWRKNGGNLFNTLSPDTASKLRNAFSFKESGSVQIVATAFARDKKIKRSVILERDTGQLTVPNESEKGNRVIRNNRRFYP